MNQTLALLITEALLKYGPGVARSLVGIFSKEVITQADWDEVFKLAETKSYAQYTAPKA